VSSENLPFGEGTPPSSHHVVGWWRTYGHAAGAVPSSSMRRRRGRHTPDSTYRPWRERDRRRRGVWPSSHWCWRSRFVVTKYGTSMAAIYPATARELDPWSSSPSTCSSVSSTSSVAAEGYHGHVGVVVRDDELVLSSRALARRWPSQRRAGASSPLVRPGCRTAPSSTSTTLPRRRMTSRHRAAGCRRTALR
jgi:hypothetical protein